MLYSHLTREYRELCRAHQLLQARCGKNQIQGWCLPSSLSLSHWNNVILRIIFYSDVEREEKQLRYYQVKLEAAETKLRDFEKYFSEQEEDQSDLTKKLIDERESQTLKIFHLSEKLKIVLEREQTLRAEVQEAKDQSELLEFRVLELEECQEREKVIKRR